MKGDPVTILPLSLVILPVIPVLVRKRERTKTLPDEGG